jgi:hypothetical protein
MADSHRTVVVILGVVGVVDTGMHVVLCFGEGHISFDATGANAAAANATSSPTRRRPTQERVRPIVQRILDSINAPAYVRNGRLDLLAANTLGHAPYAPVFEDSSGISNMARFLFLRPASSDFFPDSEKVANDAVAILRAAAGRGPYDKLPCDLVGELSTRSDEFRVRWAAHNVKFHRTGAKTLDHPVVGDPTLDYEALDLPGDTGQRILIYSAEPGSPSQQALDLLASWATALAGADPGERMSTNQASAGSPR